MKKYPWWVSDEDSFQCVIEAAWEVMSKRRAFIRPSLGNIEGTCAAEQLWAIREGLA